MQVFPTDLNGLEWLDSDDSNRSKEEWVVRSPGVRTARSQRVGALWWIPTSSGNAQALGQRAEIEVPD